MKKMLFCEEHEAMERPESIWSAVGTSWLTLSWVSTTQTDTSGVIYLQSTNIFSILKIQKNILFMNIVIGP